MQSMDLLELLKREEGKTLEFKEELSSRSHDSLARTICAFANTAGGDIVFGIEDKTKYIKGVSSILVVEETIVNIIDTYILPKIIPDIEVLPFEEKLIVVVRIYPNSPLRPYYLIAKGLKNGTYIRIGSSNRVADPKNIEELQRVGKSLSFEEEPLVELDEKVIDFNAMAQCFSSIRKLKYDDLFSFKLLTKVHGRVVPTKAGVILFGKNRVEYFPKAQIKAVRFSGIIRDPNHKVVDQKTINAYPVIAVQEAVDFVQKHSNYESEVTQNSSAERWNIQRVERWNVPMTAIREAITNSVVHSDYSQNFSEVHLFIYQDRIEIQSPGLLLFGLTIEDIAKGISKLRNPIMGNIFNKLGLIEQYGSGINEIIRECQKYGLKKPKFEEIDTQFRVTIYTVPEQTPALDKLDNIIVDILKYQFFSNEKEGLSTKEITERANLSQRAVRTHLLSLVQSGFVVEIAKSTTDPKKKYFLRAEYAKMQIFVQNNKIREALEDLTNSSLLTETECIKRVENILKYPAKSIPSHWHWERGIKCRNVNGFAFAMGLADFKSYRDKIAERGNEPRDFANSRFVKDYIKEKGVKAVDYPKENDIVLYWDRNENIKHAGIVRETLSITVESQWGTWPFIFKHKLRDVPTSYGSIVKFYSRIEPQDVYAFFENWSNTQ